MGGRPKQSRFDRFETRPLHYRSRNYPGCRHYHIHTAGPGTAGHMHKARCKGQLPDTPRRCPARATHTHCLGTRFVHTTPTRARACARPTRLCRTYAHICTRPIAKGSSTALLGRCPVWATHAHYLSTSSPCAQPQRARTCAPPARHETALLTI